jgi:hypothetical protein
MPVASRCRAAIVLVAAIATVSCSNSNNSSTTAPSPTTVTETVSVILTPVGETAHAFVVSQPGTMTATLTGTSPAALTLGFGVGVPVTVASGGCSLTFALTAVAGPAAQITAPIDAGRYCFAVWDVGALTTQPVTATVTVVHP